MTDTKTTGIDPNGFAAELATLIRDLRARGVWIEPDLSWPFLKRYQAPLFVALGRLCKAYEEHTELGDRTHQAIGKLRDIGKRSHLANWFERDF